MYFSIIITSFRQPVFLKEAILSCYNQTFQKPFQVIVVNDSGDDLNLQIEFPNKPNIDFIYIKKYFLYFLIIYIFFNKNIKNLLSFK